MCKTEDRIQAVRENKAYVFNKKKFWLTFGLSVLITIVGAISYVIDMNSAVCNNTQRVCDNKTAIDATNERIEVTNERIDLLAKDVNDQDKIQQTMSHNIELICRALNIEPLKVREK